MGLPLKGLLKGLKSIFPTASKSAKIITESGNPVKVFKEVSKVTEPIYKAILPKAVISTAKEATGARKLLKNLVPKDVTKMIIPIPRPLTESEKLASTIKRFQEKYPKGFNRTSGIKTAVFGGTAIAATGTTIIIKNRK